MRIFLKKILLETYTTLLCNYNHIWNKRGQKMEIKKKKTFLRREWRYQKGNQNTYIHVEFVLLDL
jgi:hypothetical protein